MWDLHLFNYGHWEVIYLISKPPRLRERISLHVGFTPIQLWSLGCDLFNLKCLQVQLEEEFVCVDDYGIPRTLHGPLPSTNTCNLICIMILVTIP